MRKLTCPRCRQAWEVEAVRAGMKAVCPHCQATITIAAPPAKSPPQGTAAPAAVAPAPAAAQLVSAAKPVDTATPVSVAEPVAARPATLTAAPNSPAAASVEAAPSDDASLPDRKFSRKLLYVGAVVLLSAIGAGVFVWRPWLPNDGVPAEQTAALSPTPDNDPTRMPAAVATRDSSPLSTSNPTIIDQASNDQSGETAAAPSELVPPVVAPSSSPPRVAMTSTPPRPSPTSSPVVVAPQPTPLPAATRATPAQIPALASTTVYDKSPLPAGSEGAEPVTANVTVRTGQRLHAEFQGKWYAVTVVEGLADGNVRVRWETWGRDVVGNVSRSRLRLPGGSKAAASP